MNYKEESLRLHEEKKGKLEIKPKVKLDSMDDLSLAYTPGVAEVCRKIHENKEDVYKYTTKQNMVAVVTDGSAVLGLGNIGPEAALPVMEGKAIILKKFADIDAIPICLNTQDADEIINTVRNISPSLGGINLEDIAAPKCFEIEKKLQDIGIPVFHDDQHGTSVVVLAALINSLKLIKKEMKDVRIVINGAGAAGIALAKLLTDEEIENPKDLIVCDSKGIISEERDDLSGIKVEIAGMTNKKRMKGTLKEAIKGMDIFIGVSVEGTLNEDMIRSMNKDPVIFAMANPIPEIMPKNAKNAGAKIVATGRSDFPNQINNSLAFPGIFRGLLDARAKKITTKMKIEAAKALAKTTKNLSHDSLLPNMLDKEVVKNVAEAIKTNSAQWTLS